MSIETQLRDALTSHAGSIESMEAHPYERVAGAVAKNRTRRRTVGAAAVAVVAAIVIGVPTVSSRLADGRATPAGSSAHVPPPTDKAWRNIATWPTRGELANDPALVAKVDAKFSGRTIFIEDMGAERVALIANNTGTLVFATGPRGAVANLSSGQENPTTDYGDQLLSIAGGGQLVFLTTPNRESVEVSVVPEVGLDGSVKRSWATIALPQGLGRTTWTPLTRYRLGDTAGAVDFLAGDGGVPLPEPSPCPGECPTEDRRAMVENTADLAAARLYGLAQERITTRTSYVGDVPADITARLIEGAPKDTSATLQVTFSTLPEGQVLRTVHIAVEDSNPEHSVSLELANPVPASTPDIKPIVLNQVGQDSGSTTAWVVAPGAAAVQAVSKDTDLWPSSGRLPLKGGAARIELPVDQLYFQSQYDLRVFDASGRALGTYPVLPSDARTYEVTP
ncbi:hypothetical protein ACOCJ7_13250 [Knoellia sp. CPCC 206453]|uniref:hypothetical protein n=1 Tax=Knoellia pratensis TaxID=3404796 RepID=UPI003606A9DE